MFLKTLHINTGDPDSGESSGLLKDPTVQTVTISNFPADILQAIDELAARQHRSRSSFVRRELQRIVAEYQTKDALRRPTPRN
jgi:Ribbon-helix-helix protein, copG family